MVDTVSSLMNLCVGKDSKAEAQFGFSREQYETLLAFIQQSQNDSSPTTVVHQCTTKPTCFVFSFPSLILDSGVNDYICPFKSLFQISNLFLLFLYSY